MEIFRAPLLAQAALALAALALGPLVAARADERIFLSSLDLSQARQGWGKPQADQSVDGHALTLNKKPFAHGFGTHSRGLLVIDVNGATRLTATVGIDDEVGPGRGSAEFQVLGGNHGILWSSGITRSGQPPKSLDLDLHGQRRIILRVTDGGDGFEYDHADWADAQFAVIGAPPVTVALVEQEPSIAMTAVADRPEIHPPLRVGIRPGTPLLWTIPATGAKPLTFAARRLPKGLTLNPQTGTLTGTLPKAGDYAVSLSARNAQGRDEKTVHLVVGPTITLTPPMGWNSYDAYGSTVDEAQTLANARYLREKMQPYGWDTVVVDYRWYDPQAATMPDAGQAGETLEMDAWGRLLPAPDRFPSAANGAGFRGLADRVHALGLKFGIHIMRGIPRNAVTQNLPVQGSTLHAAEAANTSSLCPWCPDMYGVKGNTPAGQAYYDSLFRLYASWGVDFVKMDDTSAPYASEEIDAIRRAIDRCGRTIVYSLSPGETPIEQASHVASHANLWRVSGDFWDNWSSLDHEFALGTRWQKWAGPGHWPDADMLPVGHISRNDRPVGPDRSTHFTKNEQMTLLSLWAVLPSPLMVGANLPDNDPWTLALLTNPEVLAVNQDSLGAAGNLVVSTETAEVWTKLLADGSLAVGLFNRDDLEASVTLEKAALGLHGSYTVRDLWQRKDRGRLPERDTLSVPGHGAALLRLTKTP